MSQVRPLHSHLDYKSLDKTMWKWSKSRKLANQVSNYPSKSLKTEPETHVICYNACAKSLRVLGRRAVARITGLTYDQAIGFAGIPAARRCIATLFRFGFRDKLAEEQRTL